MSRSQPYGTAVAVRGGQILEVGSLESLQPWLKRFPHDIDDRFADKTILPGFIDPHLHPSLGAVLLPSAFVTAFPWDKPEGKVQPTRGRDAYLTEVKNLFEKANNSQPWFISWGYHHLWHGEVTRSDLNEISSTQPIAIWHRSFHELIFNDAALEWLDFDPDVLKRHPQIDVERGRFSELGMLMAVNKLRPVLFEPQRFAEGINSLLKVLHKGGHTTVADMAWGIFDYEQEWTAYSNLIDRDEVPLRCMMVPRGLTDAELIGAPEEVVAKVEQLSDRGTDKLFFGKHVKLFTDGAFFSELMQLQAPGFMDGHEGEWLMAPEQFSTLASAYWNKGYHIHVHCTGDLGLELALETLSQLQWERPRFDHRFTIEHFGLSTEEQVDRIKALGAQVSSNIYYLHELGEAYGASSVGHERASQFSRLGSLARAQVPFALHSDYTMAPAVPLNSAWVAVNRLGETGAVLCPEECITVTEAMQAITINAARMLGLENEIGSIRSGKKADFTVLNEDPWEVDPRDLRDIDVFATVFEGSVFEIQN